MIPITAENFRKSEPIKNLGKEIMKWENAIDDAMHQFYGSKPKYIVFLSISDGASRAYVTNGIGNSLSTSWKNAVDRSNKLIKDRRLQPIWFKVDVVKEIRSLTQSEFLQYLNAFKRNYFREGISFDPFFSTAFLEQEVNANVFVHENKSAQRKELVWKNINFYLKRYRFEEKNLSAESTKNIYPFTTHSLFCDSDSIYPLCDDRLDHGRRKVEDVSKAIAKSLVAKSSAYLKNQILETGKFRYGYFPCFDKEIDHYNHLRHSSSVYSLLESYELVEEESYLTSAMKAINYLIRESVKVVEDNSGVSRAFVIENLQEDEIKLGANAAAILAMAKYTELTQDNTYMDMMHLLAEGIFFFHNPADGSFCHVLNYPDLSVKERFRIVYYDGEAAFALMRLYALDQNPRWLDLVKKSFRYFIEKRYWNNKDHWLSYCSFELVKVLPQREYIEFNLRNAAGILDFALERETTFPTILELLMATYQLVQLMKLKNIHLDLLATFDESKLERAILHRARHQLNGYFWPEMAMYFKAPLHILNSFYIRHHSFRVRIDDVEHNLSGYCSYFLYYNR